MGSLSQFFIHPLHSYSITHFSSLFSLTCVFASEIPSLIHSFFFCQPSVLTQPFSGSLLGLFGQLLCWRSLKGMQSAHLWNAGNVTAGFPELPAAQTRLYLTMNEESKHGGIFMTMKSCSPWAFAGISLTHVIAVCAHSLSVINNTGSLNGSLWLLDLPQRHFGDTPVQSHEKACWMIRQCARQKHAKSCFCCFICTPCSPYYSVNAKVC